jgi:ribosomal protein S21
MVNCIIYPAEGESIESVWRRFRKGVDRAGVLTDVARSREFVPKSQKRATKSSKARARRAKSENA